jgi:hypothetical protein
MAKTAFNALLVVLPYKPETPEFVAFEAAVKNHSLMKYNFDFEKSRADVSSTILNNKENDFVIV